MSRSKSHLTKRERDRINTYGLWPTQFEKLYYAQAGRCAVCKIPHDRDDLHVDHDHLTGKVRGLLCRLCNLGLGCFKDQVEYLKSAITYLNPTVTKIRRPRLP